MISGTSDTSSRRKSLSQLINVLLKCDAREMLNAKNYLAIVTISPSAYVIQ